MKIHVVCHNINEKDRILTRLAFTLAEGAGWSISERPDPRADLNYSDTYLDWAQRFTDWTRTRWAAYFSHYEHMTPFKRFFWETAANGVQVKTVIAGQYGRMLKGTVIKVPHPVELDRFTIQERKPNARPLIGFSGFVDRSGRKGEKLAARLAADLDDRAEFIACGQGWPVNTVLCQLDELAAFYNRLDVYVCTSSVEGGPLPPMECLACGVPVVIPRGVGMLDELPDVPGVYRYNVGDYAGLRQAVEIALADKGTHDRERLRAIAEPYSPAAYVRAHITGFEQYLNGNIHAIAPVAPENDEHGKRGVLYVAYGGPARDCAKGAIATFKQFMPGIPVALVSTDPGCGEDVFIQYPDVDIGGRAAKTEIYKLAPADWQYVLYLDADTEVIADIGYLYQPLIDGWDWVICKNPQDYHVISRMMRPDNREECESTFKRLGSDQLMQLNGGVFAFQRNPRTESFFTAWHREWEKWGRRDQAALLRALWDHRLKTWVLGNEWNTVTRYTPADQSAGILHYPMTARRWRGVLHSRSDDPTAWDAVKKFEAEQKEKAKKK